MLISFEGSDLWGEEATLVVWSARGSGLRRLCGLCLCQLVTFQEGSFVFGAHVEPLRIYSSDKKPWVFWFSRDELALVVVPKPIRTAMDFLWIS